MTPPRLHLPDRLEVPLATRVFYRADGSLFGIQNVPENLATVMLADLQDVRSANPVKLPIEGEPVTLSVPVITFIKMSITLTPKGQAKRGSITMFVEEPQAEPGVVQ